MNIHYLIYFFVRYPWMIRWLGKAIYFECLNGLFYLIFILGNLLRHKEERGCGWWATLRFALRVRHCI